MKAFVEFESILKHRGYTCHFSGSRYLKCNTRESDWDLVVYSPTDGSLDHPVNLLEDKTNFRFDRGGSDVEDAVVESYKCHLYEGTVNIICVYNKEAYSRWLTARAVAEGLGLYSKPYRVELFQYIRTNGEDLKNELEDAF